MCVQKRVGGGEAQLGEKPANATENEVYNHVAKYAKPHDGIGAWIVAHTLAIFWVFWWIAGTYEGPAKGLVVGASVLITSARPPECRCCSQ